MGSIDAPDEPGPWDEGHEHWLAMKSAYAEYRRASEALECISQATDVPLTGENPRLSALDGQQRAAFERYLETRMEFLEFQCDDRRRRSVDPVELPAREATSFGTRPGLRKCDWILRALTIVLLITAASFLVRAQWHVHHLEVAYEELRTSLNETRGGIQLFAKRLDDQRPNASSTIQQIEHAAPPAPTPQKTELKPTLRPRWRRLPKQPVQQKLGVHREQISTHRSPGIGAGSYHSFLLSPFQRFKRIGSIEVSFLSIDRQRGCVSLSVGSDSSKTEPQCLRLNQPLWINTGSRARRLQLVVDWIDWYGIHGHLIEFRGDKSDLSASRIKSGTQANP